MNNILNNQLVLGQIPALTPNGIQISSSERAFIEANTVPISVTEMKNQHIIPVWTNTNEPLISHSEFIESVWECAHNMFPSEEILKPSIRVSHAVRGRVPEAKHKAASELSPWEQTIYYERMMFVIEIKSIRETVNGNEMSLMLGGVKSYNLDNLYGRRAHGDQHFQMFIGFQNKACCNLCVWSDGLKIEQEIQSVPQLKQAARKLIADFNFKNQIELMRQFDDYELLEHEFAQIVGRAKMFRYMPEKHRQDIYPFLLGDQQLTNVVGSYYTDENFASNKAGGISLWNFLNLMTGANKSSYIDTFLVRSANAMDFTNEIMMHKLNQRKSWYLS